MQKLCFALNLLLAGAFALARPTLHPYFDGLVCAGVIILFGGGWRGSAALLVLACGWASFVAGWPWLWLFLWAPLPWVWRGQGECKRWPWESLFLGWAFGWFCWPYVEGVSATSGWLLRGAVGLLFSVQFFALAAALRRTRQWPAPTALGSAAVVAFGVEWLRTNVLEWPFLMAALPGADSPLAQLAPWLGVAGISFLVYWLNFQWLPANGTEVSPQRRHRLSLQPVVAGVVLLVLLLLGERIERAVPTMPFPARVLVVQPCLAMSESGGTGPTRCDSLHEMTETVLLKVGAVDLVVWPEAMLAASQPALVPEVELDPYYPAAQRRKPDWTLQYLYRHADLERGTNFLIGGFLLDQGSAQNSALLVSREGELQRQDKTKLVPIGETLPGWLQGGRVQSWLRRLLGEVVAISPLDSGERVVPFTIQTRDKRRLRVQAVVCYEMFFPNLPHFRQERIDFFVHITNEDLLVFPPGFGQQQVWTWQYRAIETRAWQVACTNCGNSCVVDPRGRVLAAIPQGKGWLLVEKGLR